LQFQICFTNPTGFVNFVPQMCVGCQASIFETNLKGI
jgi:hypothetical protein